VKIKDLIIPLKSMVVGASMVVPGVSGGTMAILLGFYDELIHSVSCFMQAPKKNAIFLCKFLLGSVLGIVLFSRLVEYLITAFPQPMMYFFLGAIGGGIPALIKKSQVTRFSPMCIIHVLGGFALVALCSLIPQDLLTQSANGSWTTFLWMLLAGVIVAIALVLPGISTSHMLLMLGLYEMTLAALHDFNLALLLPLVLGVGIGTLATTRTLENLMTRHPKGTYLWIIGFVLGSVITVFPGLPTGINWIICPVMTVVGFFLLFKISQIRSE